MNFINSKVQNNSALIGGGIREVRFIGKTFC
jgi:hypothetical protein